MKVEKTERGFELIEFKDIYGSECSLQQSSIALCEKPGTGAIWFGVGDNRMHIDFKLLKELLPHLKRWEKYGSFQLRRKKMKRPCNAVVLSILGNIFFRAGRALTWRHYFTFGGWVLSISIYFNKKALTRLGLLIAQQEV